MNVSEDLISIGSDIYIGEKVLIHLSDSELEYYQRKIDWNLWTRKFKKEILIVTQTKTLSIKPLEINSPVPASRAIAEDALVYTSGGDTNWASSKIKLLEELENQEKPAVLLELVSGQQVWCNRIAADVMRLSPSELLKIKSYEHWVPGEQERLWTEVRAGNSSFNFDFQTIHCQSGDRLQMKTSNRLLEFDGIYYRFSVADEVSIAEPAMR
ncbi:MAG: hypothetical protein HC815_30855 [Richelia sp. RM1_1_1]|nr:hypothetical protein [Richelia sp. RM1_1_1]